MRSYIQEALEQLNTINDIALLNEQAMERDRVYKKLNSMSEQVLEHCIKCFLYGKNDNTNYQHWLLELGEWFTQLGNITMKPNSKKPTISFYLENLFTCQGDEVKDYNINLNLFLIKHKDKYQQVKIDYNISNKFFDMWDNIANDISTMMNSKKEYSRNDYVNKLDEIISTYYI